MATIGERLSRTSSGNKRPRWADLKDSDDEPDVEQLLLHTKSYDQSQDLSELQRTFSSTMSSALATSNPPVGNPLADSTAEHSGMVGTGSGSGKEGGSKSNRRVSSLIDRRAPPKAKLRSKQGSDRRTHHNATQVTSSGKIAQGHSTKNAVGQHARKRSFAKDWWQQTGPEDEADVEGDDATSHAACETETSAEDLARRIEKRHLIVETIKASPQYQAYQSRKAVGWPEDEPHTPDPSQNISKRAWERLIMDWRFKLREQAVE